MGNQEIRTVQKWFVCVFACLDWFSRCRLICLLLPAESLGRWGLQNGGALEWLTDGWRSKQAELTILMGGATTTLGCSQTQIKQPCCYPLKWVPLRSRLFSHHIGLALTSCACLTSPAEKMLIIRLLVVTFARGSQPRWITLIRSRSHLDFPKRRHWKGPKLGTIRNKAWGNTTTDGR